MLDSQNALKYFNKSKFFYKLTWYAIVWTILFSQIVRVVLINVIVKDILVVLLAIASCVFVPLGIFYLIKSYTTREPPSKYKLFYLSGHLLFLFILISLIVAVCLDLSKSVN
jgi:hypothetical protein